jgi:hypothetical protein
MTFSVREVCSTICGLQSQYRDLVLCGASALILKSILPDRPIGDVDFVTNKFNTILDLNLSYDHYSDSKNNGEYSSYSGYYGGVKINVLHFKEDANINLDQIIIYTVDNKLAYKIICQDVDDIIYWKERYGRPKDIKDLDNIASNLLEKEIFTK